MRYALNEVVINGYATYGLSGNADISLGATGYTSNQVPLDVVPALIQMGASGVLVKAIAPISTAAIEIDASAEELKKALVPQTGPAAIVITARYAIPDPMPVPTTFYPARTDNVIVVEEQDNIIEVPAAARTVTVEAQDRVIVVAAEMD